MNLNSFTLWDWWWYENLVSYTQVLM